MHLSDRALANFYLLFAITFPFAYLGFFALFMPGPFVRTPMAIIPAIVTGAFFLILATWLFFRNRPAWGRNEDEVRRNVKGWYRDAKKWMDEHPEHVDMKDL